MMQGILENKVFIPPFFEILDEFFHSVSMCVVHTRFVWTITALKKMPFYNWSLSMNLVIYVIL
jgi:hypothetical protein